MNAMTSVDYPSVLALKRNGKSKAKRNKNEPHNFFESAPDPTIVINKEGKVALASSTALKLFGYAKKKLLGKSIELLIPDIGQKLPKSKAIFFRSPKALRLESTSKLFAVKKNGEKLFVDISLGPIRIGKEIY